MVMIRLTLSALLCTVALTSGSMGMRDMAFKADTPAEAREWQSAARAKLFALMMGGSQPQRVPLSPQIINTIEEDGCTLQEITIQSLPDRRIHAWVAMPEGGRAPAVLALHGHGGSGWPLGPSGTSGRTRATGAARPKWRARTRRSSRTSGNRVCRARGGAPGEDLRGQAA